MGEPTNTSDPIGNACAEIEFPGGWPAPVKTVPSPEAIRRGMDMGGRILIVAPTGAAARAMREKLGESGYPIVTLEALRAAEDGVGCIAVEALGDLPDGFRPENGIGDADILLGVTGEPARNPDLAGMAAVVGMGEGRTIGTTIDFLDELGRAIDGDVRGDRDVMDELFGEDAMRRERTYRRTVIIADDRPMRDMAELAMKASLPAKGYDYGAINQRHTIRNGTRVRPTRGRYKG